jgi:hypothetical protein
MTARRCCALLIGAAILSASPTTKAEPRSGESGEADRLFEAGIGYMRAGDYERACDAFRGSLAIESGVGSMLWLAECLQARGQTASAWSEFLSAAVLASSLNDPREKIARANAEKLEPHLSRLAVNVPSASRVAGLTVTRDGVLLPPERWSEPVPVDPGDHLVRASAPGRETFAIRVAVTATQPLSTVTIAALAPLDSPGDSRPPVSPSAPSGPEGPAPSAPSTASKPSAAPGGSSPVLKFSLLGAGIVGVVAGSAFGIAAKANLDISNNECGQYCTQRGIDARSRAIHAATFSTIFFALAGASAAGLAIVYLTRPQPSAASTALSLTAAGVSLVGTL